MQETRLKKSLKTDIFKTLASFNPGESEIIPFSESQTTTETWRVRARALYKEGTLEGRYKAINIESPRGTLLVRIS